MRALAITPLFVLVACVLLACAPARTPAAPPPAPHAAPPVTAATEPLAVAADNNVAHDEPAPPAPAAPPTKTLPYDVALPAGFVRLVEKDDSLVIPGDDGRSWAAPEGLIVMYGEPKHGATVQLIAREPDHGNPKTWARRMVNRAYPGMGRDGKLEVWGNEPGNRSAELHDLTDGCDILEIYARFVERGEDVYEVRLEIWGKLGRKLVNGWVHAFLDDPLGAPPSRTKKPKTPQKPHARKSHR